MANIALPSTYMNEVVRLRTLFTQLMQIEDVEDRYNAYAELRDEGLFKVRDFLIEIHSSIELWVMTQSEDPEYDNQVDTMIAWQRLLKKTEAKISDLDDILDLEVPVKEIDNVFLMLLEIHNKMPTLM